MSNFSLNKGNLLKMKNEILSFRFLDVDERPLMETDQTAIVVTLALLILVFGIIIHLRIFRNVFTDLFLNMLNFKTAYGILFISNSSHLLPTFVKIVHTGKLFLLK